jgi:hypothetical protein
MSEKAKEERALRTISVSSRAALNRAATPRERKHIRNRAEELLDELEEQVRQDGNDPEIREAIDRERTEAGDSD